MSHSANDPLAPADSKPHPRTPQSMTTRAMVGARDSVRGPERGHYIRCAIFFVLEGLYIGLAAVLLKQPLPLPDHIPHFPISSLKSGVTTVSILWHTTAGFFGSDVLADSFSREWSVNPRAPADRVSTITSGILDRFYHIFSSVSTKTFKFTFCAWILMFALLRVGPSTIIVLNGFDVRPISIGGLVLGSSDTSHDVLKVEQLLGINTGYDTQPNVIIPKPASDDLSQSGSIEYNSDLVYFNHSCEWHAPTFMDVGSGVNYVMIQDEIFQFQFATGPYADDDGAVLLATTSVSLLERLGSKSPFPADSGVSALLIFGGNSSIPLNGDDSCGSVPSGSQSLCTRDEGIPPFGGYSTPSWQAPRGNTIDLSHLPTVHNVHSYNISFSRFPSSGYIIQAPLATALLCDAHAVLRTGRVRLTLNKLAANSTRDGPGIGNIELADIPSFFADALSGINDQSEVIKILEQGQYTPFLVDFSPLASKLLMGTPGDNPTWVNASVPPLSLDQIARNMDRFVLSVSKVQRVDGTQNGGTNVFTEGSPIHRAMAMITSQDQVLTADPHYLTTTAALALLTFLSTVVITVLIRKQGRPPFDLKHILAVMQHSPEFFSKVARS